MEAYLSVGRNPVIYNEFVQNIKNLELYSSLQANTFENIQTEFQPTEKDSLFAYSSQDTKLQYNPQMEENFMKPQIYDAREYETSLQWQNHFPAYQPNSHFECNFPSEANLELRQDISIDSQHTTTASENLLGLDSLNNDFLLQTIDSILLGTPLSDFNFLDSQEIMRVLEDEPLATNFGSTSDNNYENPELSNNPFKRDLNVDSLKFSWSNINSDTFIEDRNFQTQAKSNFENTYNSETFLDKLHTEDTLFKQNCTYSTEMLFQNETRLQTDFERHMLTHAVLPIQSDVSKRKMSEKEHPTRQTLIHTEQKTYQCEVCKRKFSRKFYLNRHRCLHTLEKSHQCDVCKRKFSQKSGLTYHMRTHTGERPFECNVCKRKFLHKQNLTQHMRVHTGEKPYQCDVCKQKFSQKSGLTYHMRTHTGERPFECNVCKRKFSQKYGLTYHMRTHTGEKPYQCNVCKRKFSLKYGLTCHMRTHTGERPYQCNVCKRKFLQKQNLTQHIRTHTGERLYQCDVCKRKFLTKHHLTQHMRTHTGEKPYHCDVCKRKFSQKVSLTRHIHTHTDEKP